MGFMPDPTLIYNQHISSLIHSVLHKLTPLGKMKRYMTHDTATQLYKTMLLPYFDYAHASMLQGPVQTPGASK